MRELRLDATLHREQASPRVDATTDDGAMGNVGVLG